MAQTTFANSRGIVHKSSGGLSIVFPDVCKLPNGVPVPFPNTGKASDTSKGPKTVFTDGQMPMVSDAQYSKSTGDEPGKGGGVVSQVNRDVCEFVSYSFDVKFEDRNVCRLGDTLLQNKKNILG